MKKFQPILAEIKNELMSDDVEVADLSTRNIVSLTVSCVLLSFVLHCIVNKFRTENSKNVKIQIEEAREEITKKVQDER